MRASHCPEDNVFVMPAPKLQGTAINGPNLSQKPTPAPGRLCVQEAGPLVKHLRWDRIFV